MAKAQSTKTSSDRVVSKKELVSLIREEATVKGQTSEINGAFGERVKNAIDNKHLHRGAYRLMVKLNHMDELKRNDFIRQANVYVEMCREAKVWGEEHVGDLDDLSKRGDGEEQREDDKTAEDAVALREAGAKALAKGIKQLKPAKGLEGADAPSGTRIQ